LDKIDSDAVIDVIAQMTGAPMNTLNSDEKVADIRNQRAQQQQAQSQLVEADMMSDMVEKAGNTERNLAQAERARK
jgi:hypothetical protein